jgi:xylulokinase
VNATSELPLLGIDIGTSATKAVLVTPAGRVIARARRDHDVSLPAPGHVEHDADAIWMADVIAVVAELKSHVQHGLAGVCVSGIGPCLLPADGNGTPLRPAILYGIDTRATAEIDALHASLGEGTIFERCGSVLTTQAVGPKLLWLRRHEPDVWRATKKIFMASSYIVHRLTGEYVLDHHSASQCTPLYDLRAGTWIDAWAEEIARGLPLPRLLWPGELAGRVTLRASEETGIPAGTPVAAGTVDAWAEALSAGVRHPGDLMLMYGTTMFFVLAVDRPRPNPKAWTTRGVFPGSYTLAGGMATSGALTSWFRSIAGDASYEELIRDAAAAPAGSDGLVVLPYFAGERTPLFDPQARGVICGLTLRHGRGHLYRALLEATAYGVRHNLESLLDGADTNVRLVGVGGGTQGGLWPQIVSDVTGLAQDLPDESIGASYGDAFLAGLAAGVLDERDEWARVGERVEPRAATRPTYDQLYQIYRDLYLSTIDAAHALAQIQAKETR